MTPGPAFARYDYDLLQPPEPSEEGDAERAEDAWLEHCDRAYDEMRDRRDEERDWEEANRG